MNSLNFIISRERNDCNEDLSYIRKSRMIKMIFDGETIRRAVNLLYTATQTDSEYNVIFEHYQNPCFVVERDGEAVIVPVTPTLDSDLHDNFNVVLPYSFLGALRGALSTKVIQKVVRSKDDSKLSNVMVLCDAGPTGLSFRKIAFSDSEPGLSDVLITYHAGSIEVSTCKISITHAEVFQSEGAETASYTYRFNCAWSDLYKNIVNSSRLIAGTTVPIGQLRSRFMKEKKSIQNRLLCRMIFDPEEGLIFRDLVADVNHRNSFLVDFRKLECIIASLQPYVSENITFEVYKRNKSYYLIAYFNLKWNKDQLPITFVHCLSWFC